MYQEEIEALSKEIDSTKKELEEEYGSININLRRRNLHELTKEEDEKE